MKYKLIFALVGMFTILPVSAATVITNGGYLTGAKGVDIGGNLYDVNFRASTCALTYDGCDEVSDFFFQNLTDSRAASQALMDQVFLDSSAGEFNSYSGLTQGCVATNPCFVMTPYGVTANGTYKASYFINFSSDWWAGELDRVDEINSFLPNRAASNLLFTEWSNSANVSAVPIPAAIWLFGSGLLGIGALKKRKK